MVLLRALVTVCLASTLPVAGALATGGCSRSAGGPQTEAVAFPTPPRRANRPAVAIIAPPDQQLVPLVTQLAAELGEEFNPVILPVKAEETSPVAIGQSIQNSQAKAVVLINNSIARLYRDWARQQSNPPVALVLMASFVEKLQPSIPRCIGISYEVPAVTTFVGLRSFGVPVDKVGVVYRTDFEKYVDKQQELAGVEKVTFAKVRLGPNPQPRQLKAALVRLGRANIDALWLPNDNGLLTQRLLAEVWLPYTERLGKPLIVGVPSLVRGDLDFGTYAAVPDLEALAIQAADIIYELADAEWATSAPGVQLPVSVKTYVAANLAHEFHFDPAKLDAVDFLVGK